VPTEAEDLPEAPSLYEGHYLRATITKSPLTGSEASLPGYAKRNHGKRKTLFDIGDRL
jgi:hypothetical protein